MANRSPTHLDELDLRLVAALRDDGRRTNLALARQLHTSNVTIANRLRRLTESGLLHVVPWLDLEALGFQINVLVLVEVEARHIDALARHLADQPAVLTVRIISGSYDVAAEASFRNHGAFAEFIRSLTQVPGVQQVQSSHVLEHVKRTTDWLPDERLLAAPDSGHPAHSGNEKPDREVRPTMLWHEPEGGASLPYLEDVRVAFAWHRALLRGDLPTLRNLTAEDITIIVEPSVAMAGTYHGVDAALQHARAVVQQFPLIDSTILSVDPPAGGEIRFVTRADGINQHGLLVSHRHLIRARIVEGRVASYHVSGQPD